jgi:hypothetical protein
MAADPRLLLAGRPTDVGASFSNALLNVGRAQQLQQNRKQAELNEQLQPLRNRLLQAQTTTAEQGVQTPEQIAQARQLSRLNSVADFSQSALPGLLQGIESGDVSGTISALQQRKAGLLQAASQGQQVDTTEVDDALAMAQSNPQGLAQVMQNAIDARATIQSQGRAPTTFQKGGSFQVQTPSGPAVATNIIDPTTGAQRIEITPLGEGVVPTSRIGETPAQAEARRVREAGGVAQVQADVEAETAPVIAADVAASKQAIKLSGDAFTRLEKIGSNIANFDEAIRLIDEGAETGVIASRLPSFKKASVELDALQNRLGLDVIGNTTFGALSESELKFALDTALPKNLQPQDLKRWIQRKKDSMQKLSRYVGSVATFLGTPGNTVADFIELQKLQRLDAETPEQGQQAVQPQQVGRFTIEVE